jgi:hypothetical protein
MSRQQRMTKRRRLWAGAVGCVAIATLAAVWSVDQIGLLPPTLTPRSLEMATASTTIVVDTPTPSLVDPVRDTYSFKDLAHRAVLLGSVMAHGPVHAEIARAAGVPDQRLRVEAPLTPAEPRAPVDPDTQKRAGDILKSNNQYRLEVEVDPTVPVLDVYAQAPSARQAEQLANAAFIASRTYVDELVASEQTPGDVRLVVRQLGHAKGEVINKGVQWQIAAVAFVLTLALAAALLIVVARILRGWRVAVFTEQITRS